MADTAMMIKEVTGVKEEEGVNKKIIKTLDETFLVQHTRMKVNRYWETDKVVKKMVDQLVIKVVHDNEEEVVD